MKTKGALTAGLLVGSLLISGGPTAAGTIKGKVTIARARNLADMVVYVEKASGEFAPPKKHAVMDQKNVVFIPRVLPVVAGTTVDFLNSDQVLHNVFTPDKCAKKFNLGTWPRGEVRSMKFDQVGCSAVLLCNVHPEMEAYVVVLQNPYFAVSDKSGLYAIPDVPEGTYTLRVWNKKCLEFSQQVTVPKQGDASAELKLKG
jgi:plastocyanin